MGLLALPFEVIQSINASAANPALNVVCKELKLAIEQSYTEDKVEYLLNTFRQRFKDRLSDKLVQKRLIEHLIGFRLITEDIVKRVEALHSHMQLECKSFTKTVIKYSKYDVVQRLLQVYKVDVNSLSGYAVIKAISIKDDRMTDLLLSANKIDLSMSGHKAVQYLILNGDLNRLKQLTDSGVQVKKKKKIKVASKIELTPEMLYWSTKFKQWDIVNWMMEEKGVAPNIKTIQLLS